MKIDLPCDIEIYLLIIMLLLTLYILECLKMVFYLEIILKSNKCQTKGS